MPATLDLRRGQVVGDASRRWLGVNAVTHDVAAATYAPIASPSFTGDPKAPTPAPGDNDTSVATTAFVHTAVAAAGGITQLTGDATAGPGSGSQALVLAATAVTAGSYTLANITVDGKGRLTAASTTGTIPAAAMPEHMGDVTSPAGSTVNTLATVNSNVGTWNNVTLNAKGLATAGSNQNYAVAPATWTVGSIPFAVSTATLGQNNANLFWDNANGRLGIATTTPQTPLQVHLAADTNVNFYSGVAGTARILARNDAFSAYQALQIDGTTLVLNAQGGGNVAVGGAAAPLYKFEASGQAGAGAVCAAFRTGPNGADSSSYMLNFTDYGGTVGIGGVTRNGTNTVSYNTSSDARLKSDIRESDRGLDALMAIKVSDYRMGETESQGLLAQDVAKVYPEAVFEGGDDPQLQPWMIDYGRLTPLVIKTIQQQQELIEALAAKLAALEAKQ